MKTYDSDTLLHRRQFILGRRFVESRRHWQRVCVREAICVTAHPDLNVRQVRRDGRSLTLLGYLLDAEHPEYGDENILQGFLDHLLANSAFADWVKHTYPLAGRWILIVDNGRDVRMFTDPMGLRQVFYTDPALSAECWCATQSGLIAEELKLGMDPVAVGEYVNSPPFRATPEPKWPGDTSPYIEIRHLLPNHVLDLNSRVCTRFWPDRPIGALSLHDSASISAELLRQIMRSAAARFDLAVSVSAGWDTRLVLAGSRDIADRVYFYTFSRETETVDATIAPRLLTSLGLTPHLVPVPPQMDAGLEQLYNRSYTLAHAYTGRFLQALWNEVPAGKLRVTGNAAEITRVRCRLPKGATVVTSQSLARFTMSPGGQFGDQMEQIPFVLRAWERWLAGVDNTYDVHILDLFYWEHWAGNFAAMDQAQEDMALDVLTPLNCRLLLTRMLAAPEKFRDHDHPRLYEEMIRQLWPETLAEPVNPPPPMSLAGKLRRAARSPSRSVRSAVILALRASGLYTAAKAAFDRIQKKRHME